MAKLYGSILSKQKILKYKEKVSFNKYLFIHKTLPSFRQPKSSNQQTAILTTWTTGKTRSMASISLATQILAISSLIWTSHRVSIRTSWANRWRTWGSTNPRSSFKCTTLCSRYMVSSNLWWTNHQCSRCTHSSKTTTRGGKGNIPIKDSSNAD